MVAIDRGMPSVASLLTVTVLEDDLRGALNEENLSAARRGVQGGHEFVFRFKRDGVDPGVRGLFGRALHAHLAGKRVQRPLGRIPFYFPDSLLATQLRIVA